MILIADSGSTKADWVLLDEGLEDVSTFKTMGFNPYFHDETIVANVLRQTSGISEISKHIKQVFFYGAGCSSVELCKVIQKGLADIFVNAEVVVDHDLLACAYATYNGTPSVSCIIGTGSNSCYFDGEKLYEAVPALAYILGDEGSGSYYGKKLLADYLYKKLPQSIVDDFDREFGLTKDQIFDRVYSGPNPNVFLASFMKFISKFKGEPYVDEMVFKGMKHFMEVHVMCYDDYKEVPVNFIGSLAFHFQKQLHRAAEALGINVGIIIKKPIENLVNYHIENLNLATVKS